MQQQFWRRMTTLPFLAVFFAVGIPYWLPPYNEFTGAVYVFALAGIIALVVVGLGKREAIGMAATAAGAAAAAVGLRVIVDVARDPTSHNLWPFELGYMAGGVWLAALAGGTLAAVGRRVLGYTGSPQG